MAHIHHHLSANGIGGVVMANGSMSSMQSGEGDIRRAMVEQDAIDCMVALPGQLFFGTANSRLPVDLGQGQIERHRQGRKAAGPAGRGCCSSTPENWAP